MRADNASDDDAEKSATSDVEMSIESLFGWVVGITSIIFAVTVIAFVLRNTTLGPPP